MEGKNHVKKVLKVQEQRANAYSKFKGDFVTFLKVKDQWTYQESIRTFSVQAGELSAEIREVIEYFEGNGDVELAGMLKELQSLEKDKLQMTIKLQAMRKLQILDNQDIYESDPEYVVMFKALSKEIQENIEQINTLIREVRYYFE